MRRNPVWTSFIVIVTVHAVKCAKLRVTQKFKREIGLSKMEICRIILSRKERIIVAAASYGADWCDIIIILEHAHKTCNAALTLSFKNHISLTDSTLRKSCLNIVVHDCNRSSVSDSIIYPLSCKKASHRLSLRYQAGIGFEWRISIVNAVCLRCHLIISSRCLLLWIIVTSLCWWCWLLCVPGILRWRNHCAVCILLLSTSGNHHCRHCNHQCCLAH